MDDLFSKEMKKGIVKIIDKRLQELNLNKTLDELKDSNYGIDKSIKELVNELEEVRDTTVDNENALDDIMSENEIASLVERTMDDCVDEKMTQRMEEMEDLVSRTMLKLIPEFNKRISKEIKKHFVALSNYVIKHFKEKE